MKSYTSRHSRLMAQCTGVVHTLSAEDTRRRNLLALARRVAHLERKARTLKRDLLTCRAELRFKRRELKLVTSTPDMGINPMERI